MSPTNPPESQLNATEILQLVQQEKTATLSHLVSSVVHEINNPLGCIAGNITYIKDYVKDLLKLIIRWGVLLEILLILKITLKIY